MFSVKSYWFLGFGILIMIGLSATLIYIITTMLKARDELLEDKSITIKAVVDKKIRNIDLESSYLSTMEVIVLVANKYKLNLNIYTIEDYLKYSEGDELLLKVDKSGSIKPLKILNKGEKDDKNN